MKSRSQKREEAVLRSETTKNLTPQERLSRLDKTFGKGLGAKRERNKLVILSQKVLAKEEAKEAKEESKSK